MESLDKKFIHSGQLFVAARDTTIMTVLGSCVAVCLYDPKTKIAGMNHYLLPLWNNEGLASPKYGNISIEKLVDAMESVGCARRNIIAKVFGGASPNNFSNSSSQLIGEKNVNVAIDMLQEYNIEVVARDIGGIRGRKIAMNSSTGKVIMRYTQKSE